MAFIPAEQREQAEAAAARRKKRRARPLALLDFEHRPVLGLYCQQHGQLMRLETALRRAGVEVFEADVRPPERYMMERFITAPVRFGGTPDAEGLLLDAQMKPDPDYRPNLKLVSLDIETTAQGELYSIALEGCGERQVYMLGPPNGDDSEVDFQLEYCDSRTLLLKKLNEWFARHDPDAIIGWNVVQFDLRVLHEHARRLARAAETGAWRRGNAVARTRQPQPLFCLRRRPVDHRRHRVPALGDLEFPLVQPGKRRANPARRRQVDRQPVPAHGRNQPHVRRGQTGAGQVQPQGLRTGHADFRQDRTADLPAGAGQRHRVAGGSHAAARWRRSPTSTCR